MKSQYEYQMVKTVTIRKGKYKSNKGDQSDSYINLI